MPTELISEKLNKLSESGNESDYLLTNCFRKREQQLKVLIENNSMLQNICLADCTASCKNLGKVEKTGSRVSPLLSTPSLGDTQDITNPGDSHNYKTIFGIPPLPKHSLALRL